MIAGSLKTKRDHLLWGCIWFILGSIVTITATIFAQELQSVFFIKEKSFDNPILLGSGTVIDYLQRIEKKEVKNDLKKVPFLDGPSKTAFEILMGGTSENKNTTYLPMIAMSSIPFTEKDIKGNFQRHLVELKLPDVDFYEATYFIPISLRNKPNISDTTTTIHIKDLLENIVNGKDYDVYITTDNSGTKLSYEEQFLLVDKMFKWPGNERTKTYNLNLHSKEQIEKNDKPCIILGSKYYHLSLNKEKGQVKTYRICKNGGQDLYRSLYLYFIKDKLKVNKKFKNNTEEPFFDKKYIEGNFIEELIKHINPNYYLELENISGNDWNNSIISKLVVRDVPKS